MNPSVKTSTFLATVGRVRTPVGLLLVLAAGASAASRIEAAAPVPTMYSGTGVALNGIYAPGLSEPDGAKLVNFSTRGFVGAGDALLIPGLVAEGNSERLYLVRAVGPSLAQPPFNVVGVLEDPLLMVYYAGRAQTVTSNDDWDSPAALGDNLARKAEQVGAFPLPRGSKDAVHDRRPRQKRPHRDRPCGDLRIAAIAIAHDHRPRARSTSAVPRRDADAASHEGAKSRWRRPSPRRALRSRVPRQQGGN